MGKSENSSSKTWLTIITLVVTPLLVAVIYNWEKFSPSKIEVQEPTEPVSENPKTTSPEDSKSKTPRQEPAQHAVSDATIINDTASGTVVDDKGQPIAGAKVYCSDCLSTEPVITNSDGIFRLPFRAKKTDDQQHIRLKVSGYQYDFLIRANAPQDLRLTLQ